MKWIVDYHPLSVVPGCTGGQFTLKENDENGYPFGVIPVSHTEKKEEQEQRAKIAAAAPEMLEALEEALDAIEKLKELTDSPIGNIAIIGVRQLLEEVHPTKCFKKDC